MADVAEGDKAPDFNLEADDGSRFKLSGMKGKKVVVYFYPKDDTSGCTLEAIDFTKAGPAFAKAGVTVVGISPDTTESHCSFRDKHKLGVKLVADPDHKAIDAYGLWVEKSMYGRKYMGVERATFLVGADGRIAQRWRNVKVPGHAEEVLAAAQAL
jgi:peroxiredoxin Q/BCP